MISATKDFSLFLPCVLCFNPVPILAIDSPFVSGIASTDCPFSLHKRLFTQYAGMTVVYGNIGSLQFINDIPITKAKVFLLHAYISLAEFGHLVEPFAHIALRIF